MREKHAFGTRTRTLPSSEPRRKFYLVFEGEHTERIYFEELEAQRDEIGNIAFNRM